MSGMKKILITILLAGSLWGVDVPAVAEAITTNQLQQIYQTTNYVNDNQEIQVLLRNVTDTSKVFADQTIDSSAGDKVEVKVTDSSLRNCKIKKDNKGLKIRSHRSVGVSKPLFTITMPSKKQLQRSTKLL